MLAANNRQRPAANGSPKTDACATADHTPGPGMMPAEGRAGRRNHRRDTDGLPNAEPTSGCANSKVAFRSGHTRLLTQHGFLERLTGRARVDAEFVEQGLLGGPVHLERFHLPFAALEGQDPLAAQPLSQRMLVDQRGPLASEVGVGPGGSRPG